MRRDRRFEPFLSALRSHAEALRENAVDRSSAQLERTPGKPVVDTNNEAELRVVAVSGPLSRLLRTCRSAYKRQVMHSTYA